MKKNAKAKTITGQTFDNCYGKSFIFLRLKENENLVVFIRDVSVNCLTYCTSSRKKRLGINKYIGFMIRCHSSS